MTCFFDFWNIKVPVDKFSKNTDKVISKNCNNTQTPYYVVTQHQQHSQYTKFNVPILNKFKSNYLYYAISNIVS